MALLTLQTAEKTLFPLYVPLLHLTVDSDKKTSSKEETSKQLILLSNRLMLHYLLFKHFKT